MKMENNMIDSLFDKGTMKKFSSLAHRQAKLDKRKTDLAKKSLQSIEQDTIVKVLDLVKEHGHPSEKKLSEEIKEKYFSGIELSFDDLMNLESLYKSNLNKFSKKDVGNE